MERLNRDASIDAASRQESALPTAHELQDASPENAAGVAPEHLGDRRDPILPAGATPGGPSTSTCVFCQIVQGQAPAKVLKTWPDVIAFLPLRPRVKEKNGHVLVVPRAHVTDFMSNPKVTELTSAAAAELGAELCAAAAAADPDAKIGMNLISSAGSSATQTVFHLHMHLLIRREGDKIALPWTDQES